MLRAKRLARVLEILRAEGFVSLGDIAEKLDTSVSTVRRDVDHLARIGPVIRTHGGAALNPTEALHFEPGSEIASEIEAEAKAAIGRHAAMRIEAGQTVLFDSGTTTREVARAALARAIGFTAFTNDVAIASLLSTSDRIAVHVFHGRMRPGSATLLGAETVFTVRKQYKKGRGASWGPGDTLGAAGHLNTVHCADVDELLAALPGATLVGVEKGGTPLRTPPLQPLLGPAPRRRGTRSAPSLAQGRSPTHAAPSTCWARRTPASPPTCRRDAGPWWSWRR